MAIDTRAKRQSVAGFSLFRVRLVPDGAIDASDRRHVAGLYAGISAESPAVPSLTFSSKDVVRFKIKDPL